MTPAEGLGAFEQQVRALSDKIDGLAGSIDLEAVHTLQSAVGDMRGFTQRVASAEALTALHGDVHALGERIDRIASATGAGNLESLAQRIDHLTRALDTRGADTVGTAAERRVDFDRDAILTQPRRRHMPDPPAHEQSRGSAAPAAARSAATAGPRRRGPPPRGAGPPSTRVRPGA